MGPQQIWGRDGRRSQDPPTLPCSPLYVDDYGSMEPEHHPTSGFGSFEQLNGALGYYMKKSKRQPPAAQRKIQGVIISTDNNHVMLTPCPQRVKHMQEEIQRCLQLGQLEPEQARRMAGKCNFLTGRLFGKVGRAPLKAIYARANSHHSAVDKPTKAALLAVFNIITSCRLMKIPRSPMRQQFSIIYTDAHYLAGEQRLRPGQEPPPNWSPRDDTSVDNGWGAVLFLNGDPHLAWHFQGKLPSNILRQFSSNKAFIYLLEAWVAIAPLVFEPFLGDFYIQCCDNEAARHALIKGVGKRQTLNCLISAQWTWHNRRGISHRIERVPTKANIPDPISRFETPPVGPRWRHVILPQQAITTRCLKIIGDIKLASSLGFEKIADIEMLHRDMHRCAL